MSLPFGAARGRAGRAAGEGYVKARSVSTNALKKIGEHKKFALGAGAAAVGYNVMRNRHKSGITPMRGRPTGPYMY